MINPGVIYNVTGRYMNGREVIGYHLVGEDGSQAQENRERVIFLIGKGAIANMRIQIDANKEIILRGKGVNLNNLPVYDQGKQQFRNNNISQSAANTGVSVSKHVDCANPMGQYRILRRIMYKNKCLGYEVQDYSGAITRKKREQVINLAVARLISNAVAQKCTRPNSTVPEVILRGVGCDLKALPILIVNDQGKIIDPLTDKSKLAVRGVYMKHAGMLHNNISKKDTFFEAGDFIICNPDGSIDIQKKHIAEKSYVQDKNRDSAVCDDYLTNAKYYSIEIFGGNPITLGEQIIKSWAILVPNKVRA